MKRVHEHPFGALPTAHGAQFALWAPSAPEVALRVHGRDPQPMTAWPDGTWRCHVPGVRAGVRYGYTVAGLDVPDPASRCQPDGVHADSELIDPGAYVWQDHAWRGLPWHTAVVYELHVGTFTPEGTFAAVIPHLPELKALGITAIELMPVASFPGTRGWGYDGVDLYAPHSAYGRPEDLKALIDSAHRCGLMVLLDVVYNHFGPEGNYVHAYAPEFFNPAHQTPWGAAINYDGPANAMVREFFIHNALYWLTEYHVDGLRLDAVHAIADTSARHVLDELADRARAICPNRHIHLVLENDLNQARFLRGTPDGYDAQWNDDWHHAAHVLLTGEHHGYYQDYADAPLEQLGRALAQGFVYQGERSRFRDGPRGEPSAHLPPARFVSFLQNHDQTGNRALGERLTVLADPAALRALRAVLLLSPHTPLLFMGEEWGAREPFLYFCDLGDDLKEPVREGRRREFAAFPQFADPAARERIPDPLAPETFARARLNRAARATPEGHALSAETAALLALRERCIAPLLADAPGRGGQFAIHDGALVVHWTLARASRLSLVLTAAWGGGPLLRPPGRCLHAVGALGNPRGTQIKPGPWAVGVWLEA